MRKTSASRGRQSFRKARKMRFSPFWLKTRIPDSILIGDEGGASRRSNFGRYSYTRPKVWIRTAKFLLRIGYDFHGPLLL